MWSPDGRRIAYTAARQGDDRSGRRRARGRRSATARRPCGSTTTGWSSPSTAARPATRRPRSPWSSVDDPWPTLLAGGHGDRGEAQVSPDATRVASTLMPPRRPQLHERPRHRHRHRRATSSWCRHLVATSAARRGRRTAACSRTPTSRRAGTRCSSSPPTARSRRGSSPADGADFAELRWSRDGNRILAVRLRHGVGDLVVIDAGDRRGRRPRPGRHVVVADRGSPTGRWWRRTNRTPRAPRLCRVVGGDVEELFAPTPAAVRSAPHVVPEHVSYRSTRRHRGLRLALPPRWRRRPNTRCRRSSTRTAARRRAPATSGTASPSTSSTRATPGSRSTSAAARRTAATSNGRTTACGASTTPRTASPPTTTLRRSAGSTRPASASSARATARTSRWCRSSTTSGTASPARRRSTATATSSRRGRRATSSAGSTSSG